MYLEYMGSSYFITLNEQKDQNDVSRILIFWVEILWELLNYIICIIAPVCHQIRELVFASHLSEALYIEWYQYPPPLLFFLIMLPHALVPV